MVDTVKQLCIRSWKVTAGNSDHWEAKQGEIYTTTVPDEKPFVTVFSNYWVQVPVEFFVRIEEE